ncbi:MAG TPA: 5'/3'-nucleotidase SurE [Bdellovibrionota bacterium]|nr:5'/3'-nucleotidase SurE [Bdellovibrionota bacterium]
MRILLSNDDGIDAPGIKALEEALSSFGNLFVVAPDRERSGAGHSLTLHRPLRIHAQGDRRYAVDGTPTDCVNLAIREILKEKRPDIVVSGINQGPNLGDDVIYSGTVAAALEGALMGVPSIAISLAVQSEDVPNFLPAAHFAKRVVKKILDEDLPKDVILNINVPNITQTSVDQYEVTRLGKRHFADVVEEKIDPRGKKYYWVGSEELGFDDIPGSDCNAIAAGRVSITPVLLDHTHERYLEVLRKWPL